MGYDQGFPTTGLKFANCQGQIYYDNDWIAGVEYDEYEQQENEIDDDDEEIDYEEQQQELAEDCMNHQKPTQPLMMEKKMKRIMMNNK